MSRATRIPDRSEQAARQILADLDAVGNTTKAETKGIAIGSAVIAAVSLFASFIAVIADGQRGEDRPADRSATSSPRPRKLSVAEPEVFIGMLIGGAVPFLFSSMPIRAVGRAAFLIVKECRLQFRDQEIWAGTKKPDYGRVVNICTGTAQKRADRPRPARDLHADPGRLLPRAVRPGRLPRRHDPRRPAPGRVHGQRRRRLGQRQEDDRGRAADRDDRQGLREAQGGVTGDTVGDPLKDTAGPAINPLIKVMNMVSLLALPLVILHNVKRRRREHRCVGAVVAIVAVSRSAGRGGSRSKNRPISNRWNCRWKRMSPPCGLNDS